MDGVRATEQTGDKIETSRRKMVVFKWLRQNCKSDQTIESKTEINSLYIIVLLLMIRLK
ncbi:hypothetical protein HanOQP8_Chr10g0385701 [Helianthus annuus]|nr:hypothetical protein HanOQP8_Chr10g0385701 [Helianthus annuus]